jgi:tRNA(Ile)-lysidine synthase
MMTDATMRTGANDPISVSEAAALFADLSNVPALILAVSGGPDSTALMWLAARWRARRKTGAKLVAVTVDHRLRKESAREALAVKRFAKNLKVEHHTLRWAGRKPKTAIQEAARNVRYRLLAEAARKAGARHILTAHTLDDQGETVLFRLARGSGIAGLRGMARLSPVPAGGEGADIVRPLLAIPKSRLLATLAAAKISFADDPSNRDPRFTRPRLRELMPRLAVEGLDARRLAAMARRMARADQAIERAVDDVETRISRNDRHGAIAFGPDFVELPAEIALRLLGRAVNKVGNEGPVELGKLEALYAALAAAMVPKIPAARFRRTLAGALVTFAGEIAVVRAPARRLGRAKRPKASFTKRR